jgi:hypothetical protein
MGNGHPLVVLGVTPLIHLLDRHIEMVENIGDLHRGDP